MNAFQRTMQRMVKGLFGISFGGPGADSWEYAQMWQRAQELTGDGTVTPLERPYELHGVVATAISIIAEDAASVPWELFSDTDTDKESPIDDHPVLALWERPSPGMAGIQLWVGTYITYHLFGEAFWYYPDTVLRRANAPANANAVVDGGRIDLLHPLNVVHKVNAAGEVEWALRRQGGVDDPLDADRLTHFKRWNPYSQVRGLSKLVSVAMEVTGDYEASRWNAWFFGERNGIPSGLLVPNVGSLLSDATAAGRDQRREILRTWNQKHGGKRGVGVLPAGWDFKDLGVNQRDMDFRGLREYSREQVLAAFGVPPFIAGVLDKANYANAREQKEVYWQGTIQRFLTGIQGTINEQFLPSLGVTNIKAFPNWEIVKALTENLTEKVDIAAKLFAMGFTKRQINERLELGFDVDELEDADQGYLPFSLTPVGAVGLSLAPEPMPQEEQPPPPQKGLRVVRALPSTEQRRAMVWRAITTRTRDIEAQFNKTVRRHFHEIEQEALANLGGVKGIAVRTGAIVLRERGSTLIFDVEARKKQLQRVTGPLQKRALGRGGEALLAEVTAVISFNIEDPYVLGKLAELSHKITRIDDTIERALRDSLLEGVGGQETLEQLRDRVSNVMDASLGRSLTIARTETGFAYNTGRFSGMKQAGIQLQEWLSSRDADVRDSHQIDGERVALGEPFSNGLLYPQDPAGPPDEIINCRCVPLAVTG